MYSQFCSGTSFRPPPAKAPNPPAYVFFSFFCRLPELRLELDVTYEGGAGPPPAVNAYDVFIASGFSTSTLVNREVNAPRHYLLTESEEVRNIPLWYIPHPPTTPACLSRHLQRTMCFYSSSCPLNFLEYPPSVVRILKRKENPM